MKKFFKTFWGGLVCGILISVITVAIFFTITVHNALNVP